MCSPALSPSVAPPPFASEERLRAASLPAQPAPRTEAARLDAVRALHLLDTPTESEFDDLVQLAAAICDTPISLMSLVDEHRQWFKASVGLHSRETPRNVAFCHYTIQQPGLMLVEDARQDPRFCDNPRVTGEAPWRFYAGVPLETADGHAVGTLCVLDHVPRTLTPEQQSALRILANQVSTRLELRAQYSVLEEALAAAQAARARAEALERRFEQFMDSSPFLAFMKDRDGRMVYYNKAMAQHFQVSRTDMLHKSDFELWPPELAASYRQHDLQVLESGELTEAFEDTRDAQGAVTHWRSIKFPCSDVDGSPLLAGLAVDVTQELRREKELRKSQAELEQANQRLNELASVDTLTGLGNRRVFEEQVRVAFRQARVSASPLSLLLLDVDHFKRHNDTFGHTHGDEMLRHLAECLRGSFRANDLICRYGGEEFIVLLPGTQAADAEQMAERLLRRVRGASWPRMSLTVSIGVSTLHPATRDPQHLISRADDALYAAKATGRDRVVSYANELACFHSLQHSR